MPTTEAFKVHYIGAHVWCVVDVIAKQIVYSFVDQGAAVAVCADLNGAPGHSPNERSWKDDLPGEHGLEDVSGDHGVVRGRAADDDN